MHLIQILLPVYDNHGVAIPQLHFRRVSQEMADRFGGVTAFMRSPAEGVWRFSERTSHDEIVVIEVMIESLDRTWWGEYRSDLEKRFRQEEVVVRAQEIEKL